MKYSIDKVANVNKLTSIVNYYQGMLEERGIYQMVDGLLPLLPPTHTIFVGDEKYLKKIVPEYPDGNYAVFSLIPQRIFHNSDKFFDIIFWYEGMHRNVTIAYDS